MKESVLKIRKRRLLSHASKLLEIIPERLIDISIGQGRKVSEAETLKINAYMDEIHNIKTFVRVGKPKKITLIGQWLRNVL